MELRLDQTDVFLILATFLANVGAAVPLTLLALATSELGKQGIDVTQLLEAASTEPPRESRRPD